MRLDRARAGRYARAARRWARLLAPRRAQGGIRVFYGHDVVPAEGERVAGGTAKFQRLARRFPNHPGDFNLLYLGSTSLPRDLEALLLLARRRGLKVVVNQDGVAYPGWAGEETDRLNDRYRRALHAADHVLFQSRFSKESSDLFLGEPKADVGDPLQRRRRRSLHARCERAVRRSRVVARRRPDAGVPPRARRADVRARARSGARGPPARHRPARLTGGAAARRARRARAGRARRRIRAT